MSDERCMHEMLIIEGRYTCAWCLGVETDIPNEDSDE